MQKIKGMKEVFSCPLILHVFNVSLEKCTHFILNLIYKLCWLIVQRASTLDV